MMRAFLAVLLVALVASSTVVTAAQADLTLVSEALEVLRLRHWDSNLDFPSLIRAGVGGLRHQIQRAGIEGSAIPEIPAGLDRQRTMTAFGDRLDQAVQLAAGHIPERQLLYAALRAMMKAVGGSHTYFLNPQQRANLEGLFRGQPFVGIGIRIVEAGGRKVFGSVFPGGPADRAGVRRGDILLRVGDVAVDRLELDEIQALILGETGTPVVLTIRRGSRELAMSMVRESVSRPVVAGRMLDGGIGYIKIYAYPGGAERAIRQQMVQLLAGQPRGLIVDLREHSGGADLPLRETMALFLPLGTMVAQEIRQDRVTRPIVTGSPPIVPAIPVVVLIDSGTGSNGETTAASLKESRGAVLVGARTEGALEYGILVGLADGSGVNVSYARILTRNGW